MRAMMLIGAALAAPAAAQENGPGPRIVVTGTASVDTPPDRATIEYRVTGEGATSDAAVAAMVARGRRIAAALAGIDPAAAPRSGQVSVTAVRGPDCRGRGDDEDDAPRLSAGKCAVVGYLAALGGSVATGAVSDAGTMVGLLGRLGAERPHLDGFELAHPAAAQARATAAALVDARRQAEAIAAGAGVRLGRLLVASTSERGDLAQDIVVTGSRVPPADVSPPPIVVDLAPRPVTTRAQVTVTYAIAP